ncbi:hypothetical protein A3C59_01210 [Candidatus Daviesbacteria bacterium RIFCSPHIGHO2_02_FULL_36_13]|uniref:Membrane protein 6-pyruvoyl-tetrahydropterin synthase-related domain-containing protein n=1 Tax=Candidatus Daviesbacteria bacterium RIFCSPHIGHO2_02_FULL_36_13 TaxID=1797768 RepID=A0A1F5JWC9_9BACT|nr:MAG: hypothetical protein A3C59_01210 [Candidatus Daviesbacteria bacterium RIFCSPHIGHO2_02_FULL_36_13]
MTKMIKNYWPILIILIFSIFIIWPIFRPGYFSHHDDLHVMRIFEMRKCIEDLQIPCRWVPDMGYGNGYPLFNYYNPFPYYIGAALSIFGGFVISAKLLFLIPLILGGVFMYLLGKELFNKEAGLVVGILYLFAPYRALDSFVRGAVAESFAIAIVPLVFYFLIKKKLIFFSITLAIFLTSHTIMTLLFLTVLVFLILYHLWTENFKNVRGVIFAILLGIGLSAFFTLPAYFEKNLVQIDNLARLDLDFRAHFATFPQLFMDRAWGYGASFPGPIDTISFQIGLPHWILVFLSVPFVLVLKRKERKFLVLYAGFLLLFLFSIFMTHNKSAFLWEKIGILRFTQFPWRFLAVAIFTSSILGGFLVYSLNKTLARILAVGIIILTVFLNWNYFKPEKFYFEIGDSQKLSGAEWDTQQKASILDYLPVGAQKPLEPAQDIPYIEGEAEVKNFKNKSNKWDLLIDVKSPSRIEIPVIDFPNWKVYEGKKIISHTNDNYVKRISFNLEPGLHQISGRLKNTPIREISNIITLISILTVLYLTYGKKIVK